jgi:GWxTD domain-containing protein
MRAAALAAALATAWAPAAPAAPEDAGALPWRVGGPLGCTVDAAAYPDGEGYAVEVYVRVPPGTLLGLTPDSTQVSRLRLIARLRAPGMAMQQATQEFDLAPGDTVGGLGRVVLLKFPTRPGGQRLHVRLEDAFSRRRGIAFVGRRVPESVEVTGTFAVEAPQAGRDLSDPEFVWDARASERPSAFRRGERTLLPNAERLYGRFASELQASFTARARPGDARPWHWVARALDGGGRTVAEADSSAPASRMLDGFVTLDVASLPAGGYDLEIKAWQEGDEGALLRRARFSVGWQADTWVRNPRDVQDDVHFLLDAEALERFERLHPGEQERELDDYWRRRDPTPDTAENEVRTTYLARVDHANTTWGRAGIGKGMFSDMGRTWIRYGPPSDVLHQVIPTGDASLARVLTDLALDEDRPLGDVQQKGLGGDQRPFEVWIYEGEIGLPIDADPALGAVTRRKRLVFLFVDEHGLGDFRLRYSSE